jgi:hypothetical protein
MRRKKGGDNMKKCPMLDKCEELVNETHAEHICYEGGMGCKFTEHLREKKRAREWNIE